MSPKTVATIVAVGFVTLWVLSAAWVSLKDPTSSTLANSRGTGWVGYRGLLDLQRRLGHRVERDYRPLMAAEDGVRIFLASDPVFVGQNLGFVEELRRWVERGGRAIVSDGLPEQSFQCGLEESRDLSVALLGTTVGLKYARHRVDRSSAGVESPQSLISKQDSVMQQWAESLLRINSQDMQVVRVPVTGEGALKTLAEGHGAIVVPELSLRVLETVTGEGLLGALRLGDGSNRIIAALYQLGKGQVLIVSDNRLACNGLLQYSGMGSFLIDLIGAIGPSDRYVYDHFFAGEIVRGNPGWLLVRFPYSVLASCLLLASVLIPWSMSGRLGPPDPDPAPRRPGLLDHLGMVANLLGDRRHHQDSFERLLSGVLWQLRSEFGIRRSSGATEALLAVMERRAPERAARLAGVLRQVKMSGAGPIPERVLVKLSKELVQCLSGKPLNN
jgi:hypothetical protein